MNNTRKRIIEHIINFYRKNWLRCIVAVIYQIFMAVVFVRNVKIIGEKSTFEMCWYQSFCGNLEINATNADKFELPVLWIIFQSYILYMLCDYMYDSGKGMGIQRLIRINSRKKWYLQICLTNIVTIFLYYLSYFLILQTVSNIHNIPLEIDVGTEKIFEYALACFVLPICCTVAIFLVQNLVSLYCTEFIAYIVSLMLLVVSVYCRTYYLLGNYAMLLRTEFYRKDGLNIYAGIVICLSIAVIAMLIGLIKVNSIDYIGKELEET